MTMRYVSCCSGVESASVALQPLGWEPVAFSETGEFQSAVIAHRFPDIPNLGDMTKVDWSEFDGAVDVAVSGPPCQEFSLAGVRDGVAGDRGRLYLAFLNAARDMGARWVIVENVPGILSIHGGRDFGLILREVAELWPDGGACWRVLDASLFGVPQRRRRLYLVIHRDDWRRAAAALYDQPMREWPSASCEEAWKEAAREAGISVGGYCLASAQAKAESVEGGCP